MSVLRKCWVLEYFEFRSFGLGMSVLYLIQIQTQKSHLLLIPYDWVPKISIHGSCRISLIIHSVIAGSVGPLTIIQKTSPLLCFGHDQELSTQPARKHFLVIVSIECLCVAFRIRGSQRRMPPPVFSEWAHVLVCAGKHLRTEFITSEWHVSPTQIITSDYSFPIVFLLWDSFWSSACLAQHSGGGSCICSVLRVLGARLEFLYYFRPLRTGSRSALQTWDLQEVLSNDLCSLLHSLLLSSLKTNQQNGNTHDTAGENARVRLAPFLGLQGFMSWNFLLVTRGLSLGTFCPTPPLGQACLSCVCCSGMDPSPPRQFFFFLKVFSAHNPQQSTTEDPGCFLPCGSVSDSPRAMTAWRHSWLLLNLQVPTIAFDEQ